MSAGSWKKKDTGDEGKQKGRSEMDDGGGGTTSRISLKTREKKNYSSRVWNWKEEKRGDS